jgi:gelsolin
MQKATKYNIADSNIANLGSDLEKKVRLEAAQHEQAWKGAGVEPGIQIWRIEQFKIVPVPKATYGTFYSGDSYIVLHTYKPAGKGDKILLAWDVHFWLGKYTTQDEAGTAAYKTVELDDYLGGAPVQYREVQGHESERFLRHFPKGIRLLEGGKETGFKHVTAHEYRTRLLHIKGKKNIRVKEVPLTHNSLNSGDVFIVDAGKNIIQWNGSKAGIMEKAKGAEISQAIEGEREGHSSNRVVDEGAEDAEFWALIGGKGPIKSAAEGGSDLDADKQKSEKVLSRLSDQSGKLEFKEVAKGAGVKRNLLDSNDVFILDTGAEVYAWVGKKASVAEKQKALSFAQEYVAKAGKPPHTTVARVLEGGENEVFEAAFH